MNKLDSAAMLRLWFPSSKWILGSIMAVALPATARSAIEATIAWAMRVRLRAAMTSRFGLKRVFRASSTRYGRRPSVSGHRGNPALAGDSIAMALANRGECNGRGAIQNRWPRSNPKPTRGAARFERYPLC